METRRRNLLLISAALYGGLYLLSRTCLREMYLFEWTARNNYLYLWVGSLLLLLCGRELLSLSLTVGNIAGILVGQIVGDWLRARNIAKVTPEMDPAMKAQLYHHPGFELWLATVLVFFCADLLVTVWKKKHG